MPFRVHGRDANGLPIDPLFVDTDDENLARANANAQGMQVERVEAVTAVLRKPPRKPAPDPGGWVDADHPVASVLMWAFRALALVTAVGWGVRLFLLALVLSEQPSAALFTLLAELLAAVVAVALLGTLAEVLRLGVMIERNTRRLQGG